MSAAALARLVTSLRSIITRGVLTGRRANPVRLLIQATGRFAETRDKVELFLPFGMSAQPTAGDVIFFEIGATREHVIAILDDRRLRIQDLVDDEYGQRDVAGQQIVFRQDRIEITTPLKVVVTTTGDLDATVGGAVNLQATGQVNVTSPLTVITGNLHVTGDIIDNSITNADTLAGMRAKHNGHRHTDPQGGTMSVPDLLM